MDTVLDFSQIGIGEDDAWEEEAKYKLEALVASGNKNAKEAVERFAGWQKRRGGFIGIAFVRPTSYSDLLMRIQIRELSDLARMGIDAAIHSLEEIRLAKVSRHQHVKKFVDSIHHRIIGEFMQEAVG